MRACSRKSCICVIDVLMKKMCVCVWGMSPCTSLGFSSSNSSSAALPEKSWNIGRKEKISRDVVDDVVDEDDDDGSN